MYYDVTERNRSHKTFRRRVTDEREREKEAAKSDDVVEVDDDVK